MNRAVRIVLIGMLALFAVGCDDNPDITIDGIVDTSASVTTIDNVQVTPTGPVTLAVAQTQQFLAEARDVDDTIVIGINFSWQSSDTTVMTISSTGLATAIDPGTAEITAAAGGVTSNTVTLTVDCNSIPASITNMTATPSSVPTLGTSAISLLVEDCDPSISPDIPDGTSVNFSLTPGTIGTVTGQATTVGGVASATFTAGSTAGMATITAIVDTVSNSTAVTVAAPDVGSIEFGSAVPDVIGVKTGGQPESSIITFLVKDVNGQPVVDGTQVIFTLIGPQGTSTSTPTDPEREVLTFYAVSTSGGNATTILLSGTVAGPVRIIACVDANLNATCDVGEISSSSTPLSIGGGIPSATHFSAPRTVTNLAGLAIVNEQTTISAFLADRFGNFNILEGTSISFITEAGAIDTSAVTDEVGTASVILRTQAPDPIDVDPSDPLNPIAGETYNNSNINPLFNCNGHDSSPFPGELFEDANLSGDHDDGVFPDGPCEHFTDFGLGSPFDFNGYDLAEPNPRDGWVTFVAYTRGEEAFSDLNGNGLYDTLPTPEPFVDNGGEPFIDSNDNGIYDAEEPFTDANFNNSYDLGETFTDVDPGEPFLDLNGSGSHNSGEPFTDLNGNLTFDSTGSANGVYDPGELFIDVDGNGEWTHGNGMWDADTTIWLARQLVFTGGPSVGPFTSRIVIATASKDTTNASNFIVPNGGCANFTVYVSDFNVNRLTPDSTVDISATAGELFGGGGFVLADGLSGGPSVFPVSICDDDPTTVETTFGSLTVKGVWITQTFAPLEFSLGTVNGLVDFVTLTIVTTSLPDGADTVPYSEFVTVVGGIAPYTWSITGVGALRLDLSLNAGTGEISGTPDTGTNGASACPATEFDVTVTDFPRCFGYCNPFFPRDPPRESFPKFQADPTDKFVMWIIRGL